VHTERNVVQHRSSIFVRPAISLRGPNNNGPSIVHSEVECGRKPAVCTATSVQSASERSSRMIVGSRIINRVCVELIFNGKNGQNRERVLEDDDRERWKSREGVTTLWILFRRNI
jgi:hypothetical protein